VSWTKVAMMKHKKYKCKEQRLADPFPLISNRYTLQYDCKSEDSLVNTDRLRVRDPRHGRTDKMKYKSNVMEKNSIKWLS
jgi:hypothetical protein